MEDADAIDETVPEELATTVDWTTKGIVNPVTDQGQCGSCWAFGAVASLEGAYAQKTGQLHKFSEQQLVDCSYYEAGYGCQGGWPNKALGWF